LQNPVALRDAAALGVEHGAVERMRHRTDEQLGRVRREDGVGVERDDEGDVA
jgi:hypothetical protein